MRRKWELLEEKMWPANDDFGVEYAIRHYIVISIPVNLHLDNKSIDIEILEIKIISAK